MKTTLEIPDPVFRKAKAQAVQGGILLRQFVTEAVQEELASAKPADKPCIKGAGKLRHLHSETIRIQRIIHKEFGQIEPEDRL